MGGRGSGGHRPGSGAKGNQVVDFTQPVDAVDPPADLEADALVVWERIAPFAIQARTLVAATVDRFLLLCRQVVIERQMAKKIETDGWTYVAVTVDGAGQERETLKAHPLCAAHRNMMQRVEAGMAAFALAPMGKAMSAGKKQEKPQSALERLQAQRGSGIRAVS